MPARDAERWSRIVAAMVLLVWLPPGITSAQEDNEKPGSPVIQLLTAPAIAELSLPADALSDWLRPIIAGVEARFKNEKRAGTSWCRWSCIRKARRISPWRDNP